MGAFCKRRLSGMISFVGFAFVPLAVLHCNERPIK